MLFLATTDCCARLRGLALAGLLVLLGASPAQARLGGNLASVHSDGQVWGATTSQSPLPGATVYTQLLPNGVTVRQYVDAAGLVFGVAWEGPVPPDFRRLLGPHYADYDQSRRQHQRSAGLQRPDLVIESGGMMRAFGGRAYLPTALPATLAVPDIR